MLDERETGDMASYSTKAECLVRDLDRNCKDDDNVKVIGEKLSNIAHTDEEQMVKFLKNEEAQTILVKLLYDVSILHPDQAHIFWHVIAQQYLVCQKRFKVGCMQVLKIFAKSGRLFETLPIFERAFIKNDVMLLKAMAEVRSNLGKDPIWRENYDEKADYAHMEEDKVELFVNYICSGTLNEVMMSVSLNDLMIMMMGHDALKRRFWKEHGIDKFSNLLEKLHKENRTCETDFEPVTTCIRILDSAMTIVSENPSLCEGSDMKHMCAVVFEVLKSRKECSKTSASSILLLVKLVRIENLKKHLLYLGFRELIQEVQNIDLTKVEVLQYCGMFLMMTSPSRMIHDDDDSSSSLASNASSAQNIEQNRSGRSRKARTEKRSDRKNSVRERTVRPPPRRETADSSTGGDRQRSFRNKENHLRSTQGEEK